MKNCAQFRGVASPFSTSKSRGGFLPPSVRGRAPLVRRRETWRIPGTPGVKVSGEEGASGVEDD